jgi:hypothetical protein
MPSYQDLSRNITIAPDYARSNIPQEEQDKDLIDSVKSLENKVDLLTQKCEALWTVVQLKIASSDAQVKNKIRKLNLKYGAVNNKFY